MIPVSGDASFFIDQLKEQKESFEVISTIMSKMVIFKGIKYLYADSHFPKKYLYLFQKLKKEVQKNIDLKKITVPEFEKSKYFHFKNFEKIQDGEYLSFNNCYELDINKAYYNCLYNFGYISKAFFEMCINLPKKIRLALVGTLATQKTKLYFEKGKIEDWEVKTDNLLRKVFFQLVAHVDKCLYSFASLSVQNFLFYWVDAVFFQDHKEMGANLKLIEQEYKLKFSVEKIEKVIVVNTGKDCTHIAVSPTESKNKNRVFTLPNVFVEG